MNANVERISGWTRVIESIDSPLGFFVLALLIVEGFLSIVLVFSKLTEEHQYVGLFVGVIMFIIVVLIVSVFVWKIPHNLTYNREAHLVDTGKITYGTEKKLVLHIDDLKPVKMESSKGAMNK
jgi:heme A synthase